MWYCHEIPRRFIYRGKGAFRETPLSDVTVVVAQLSILPFIPRVKLSNDGMLLVCRSELYILPRCSNIFIFVSNFGLCLAVPSCILYCFY
jgi:hypothetical protein